MGAGPSAGGPSNPVAPGLFSSVAPSPRRARRGLLGNDPQILAPPLRHTFRLPIEALIPPVSFAQGITTPLDNDNVICDVSLIAFGTIKVPCKPRGSLHAFLADSSGDFLFI